MKEKHITIGVLIITGIVVISFIVMLLFGVFNNNDNDINDNDNILQDGITAESNWINYLLSQNITEIKITRIRSKDSGDDEDLKKTININKNQLKNILMEVDNYEINKSYTLGLGGIDRDHLTAIYEIDGKGYQFELYYGSIFLNKLDSEFIKMLENNNYKEINVENKDLKGSFHFYNIIGFVGEMFDSYFL